MDRQLTHANAELLATDQKKGVAHELGVLLHSAAYAGLQSPLNAIVQPFGGKQDTFLSAPEQTTPWSLDWHCQQIGTGVGMLAPILLSRKAVTTVFRSSTAKLAAEKGIEALTKQELQFLTKYELGVSLGTGLVYGGLLTPSKLEPGQSLFDARWRQSGSAALTFGTLTLGSMGVKSLAESASLKGTTVSGWLKNETVALALAGVPAGIVSVDAHSMFNGTGLPSLSKHFDSKYVEAIYNFSIVGAGIGYLTGPKSNRVKDTTPAGLERSAVELTSRDMLVELGQRLQGPARIADLPVDAVPTPKVTYERDVRYLPRLKEGVDAKDMPLVRFEREAIERTQEPVRVYQAEGMDVRVVIPETYAARLDRYAQLKKQSDAPGVEGQRARAELERPEMAELEGRMTPEDAFRHALMTPEPGRFREIHILDRSNPYDAWYRAKTGNEKFQSSADTVFKNSQTNWYRRDRGPTLVEDTMHEWSHLFDEYHPIDAQMVRIASRIDAIETGDYANVPRERTAILVGEYILNPSGQRVADLVHRSPVTALAIAEGLLKVLSKVPDGKRSALHQAILERATLIKAEAGPAAKQSLLEAIKADPTSSTANDALRALVYLGTGKDFQGLTEVRAIDLSHEPLSDARGSVVGQIPRLTEVNLSGTRIGAETVRALQGHPLERADFSGTDVTNSSMSLLTPGLKSLDLSGAKLIGDPVVPFLLKLQGLEVLNVSNTKISQAALGQLRAGLRHTQITHD